MNQEQSNNFTSYRKLELYYEKLHAFLSGVNRNPQNIIHLKKRYQTAAAFSGHDLVVTLENLFPNSISSSFEAIGICQQLVACGYIYDLQEKSSNVFFAHKKLFYCFFEGIIDAPQNHKVSLLPKNAHPVNLSLELLKSAIRFLIDLKDDKISPFVHLRQFTMALSTLNNVDLSKLVVDHSVARAFWINLANTMMIHATILFGPEISIEYISNFKYRVGQILLSHADIINGILRNNSPIPSTCSHPFQFPSSAQHFSNDDPRRTFCLPKIPTITSLISFGRTCSNPIYFCTPTNVEFGSKVALLILFSKSIAFNPNSPKIALSEQLSYFLHDSQLEDVNDLLTYTYQFLGHSRIIKDYLDIKYSHLQLSITPIESYPFGLSVQTGEEVQSSSTVAHIYENKSLNEWRNSLRKGYGFSACHLNNIIGDPDRFRLPTLALNQTSFVPSSTFDVSDPLSFSQKYLTATLRIFISPDDQKARMFEYLQHLSAGFRFLKLSQFLSSDSTSSIICFWINVYNALSLHSLIVYGRSQVNLGSIKINDTDFNLADISDGILGGNIKNSLNNSDLIDENGYYTSNKEAPTSGIAASLQLYCLPFNPIVPLFLLRLDHESTVSFHIPVKPLSVNNFENAIQNIAIIAKDLIQFGNGEVSIPPQYAALVDHFGVEKLLNSFGEANINEQIKIKILSKQENAIRIAVDAFPSQVGFKPNSKPLKPIPSVAVHDFGLIDTYLAHNPTFSAGKENLERLAGLDSKKKHRKLFASPFVRGITPLVSKFSRVGSNTPHASSSTPKATTPSTHRFKTMGFTPTKTPIVRGLIDPNLVDTQNGVNGVENTSIKPNSTDLSQKSTQLSKNKQVISSKFNFTKKKSGSQLFDDDIQMASRECLVMEEKPMFEGELLDNNLLDPSDSEESPSYSIQSVEVQKNAETENVSNSKPSNKPLADSSSSNKNSKPSHIENNDGVVLVPSPNVDSTAELRTSEPDAPSQETENSNLNKIIEQSILIDGNLPSHKVPAEKPKNKLLRPQLSAKFSGKVFSPMVATGFSRLTTPDDVKPTEKNNLKKSIFKKTNNQSKIPPFHSYDLNTLDNLHSAIFPSTGHPWFGEKKHKDSSKNSLFPNTIPAYQQNTGLIRFPLVMMVCCKHSPSSGDETMTVACTDALQIPSMGIPLVNDFIVTSPDFGSIVVEFSRHLLSGKPLPPLPYENTFSNYLDFLNSTAFPQLSPAQERALLLHSLKQTYEIFCEYLGVSSLGSLLPIVPILSPKNSSAVQKVSLFNSIPAASAFLVFSFNFSNHVALFFRSEILRWQPLSSIVVHSTENLKIYSKNQNSEPNTKDLPISRSKSFGNRFGSKMALSTSNFNSNHSILDKSLNASIDNLSISIFKKNKHSSALIAPVDDIEDHPTALYFYNCIKGSAQIRSISHGVYLGVVNYSSDLSGISLWNHQDHPMMIPNVKFADTFDIPVWESILEDFTPKSNSCEIITKAVNTLERKWDQSIHDFLASPNATRNLIRKKLIKSLQNLKPSTGSVGIWEPAKDLYPYEIIHLDENNQIHFILFVRAIQDFESQSILFKQNMVKTNFHLISNFLTSHFHQTVLQAFSSAVSHPKADPKIHHLYNSIDWLKRIIKVKSRQSHFGNHNAEAVAYNETLREIVLRKLFSVSKSADYLVWNDLIPLLDEMKVLKELY